MKPEMVEVIWEDAASSDPWTPLKGAKEESSIKHIVHSVGYLMEQNKTSLVLYQSYGHDETIAGWLRIPRAMIQKVVKL